VNVWGQGGWYSRASAYFVAGSGTVAAVAEGSARLAAGVFAKGVRQRLPRGLSTGVGVLAAVGIALTALAVLMGAISTARGSSTRTGSVPVYDHVMVVVEENHGLADVIGNPAAPNLNYLARTFGLATNYFGVSHPSEPNYVALLGGSTYGVADDNPYYVNKINAPSLISELDGAGISWKAYLESLPHAGYQGICYPAKCNGVPDIDPLYVSKHVGIANFTTSLNAADWSRQVPSGQLTSDLAANTVPRFSWIIPDECRDMHGDPPYCLDGGSTFSGSSYDPQDQHLVGIGDAYLGKLVSQVTNAPFWSHGNNAIVVVFDEGDDNAGCCGSNDGGGQVAAIVVTNHGPRGVKDNTPYNHYSLLRTIQDSFGLSCLKNTCDTTNVHPMAPLFAITGSTPLATAVQPLPNLPTPTPTPVEPNGSTNQTPSLNGWSVIKSPMYGNGDNSLGAIAAAAPNDIWAVGDFLPDDPHANPDATLSLAAHYNGSTWSITPTPNAGPNFNTLFGVTASAGQAWAVGVRQNDSFQDRALVEHWDGKSWQILDVPQPGAGRDMLFSASALSPTDVWAVGQQQVSEDGPFSTLVEHWDGHTWSVVPAANPGSTGNSFYGVLAQPGGVWAVGQQNGASGPDQPLIEKWDGTDWTVVPSPSHGSKSGALFSIAGSKDGLVAVGQTEDALAASQPLVETFDGTHWSDATIPHVPSGFTSLWSVTQAGPETWAVGTFNDPTSSNDQTLAIQGLHGNWQIINGPDPASNDENRLGGVTATNNTIWAVGYFKDNGRKTLIQKRPTAGP
jgi:hypothetical protein